MPRSSRAVRLAGPLVVVLAALAGGLAVPTPGFAFHECTPPSPEYVIAGRPECGPGHNSREENVDQQYRPVREAAEGVVMTGSDAGVDVAGGAVEQAGNHGLGDFCQGEDCLPREGYTFQRFYNCGLIHKDNIERCYFPGVLGRPSGNKHSWSWGSADYDGEGVIEVGLDAGTSSQSFFGGWGKNLSRACSRTNCNDEDGQSWDISVFWCCSGSSYTRHTIYGHGQA
jgi:hypothetical protein